MTAAMAGPPAGVPPDFDVKDLIDGAALLASTANVVMQLARPGVGYGVLESTVESSQVMRHPLRRIRNTVTYLSVAFLPPPFREQMQLHWTERDQREFRLLVRTIASVNRLLPPPVSRFPFNACLQDLRLRIMWNRALGGGTQ